jgi:hypothetical protein
VAFSGFRLFVRPEQEVCEDTRLSLFSLKDKGEANTKDWRGQKRCRNLSDFANKAAMFLKEDHNTRV